MSDAEFPRLVAGRNPKSLRRILSIRDARTKEPTLMFGLKHEAGASPTYEIILSMDETKLEGPLEEERWRIIGSLIDQLTMAWRVRERQLREQAEAPQSQAAMEDPDSDWLLGP